VKGGEQYRNYSLKATKTVIASCWVSRQGTGCGASAVTCICTGPDLITGSRGGSCMLLGWQLLPVPLPQLLG
jgi:hypothetical protein